MWKKLLASEGSNNHIAQLYRDPGFLEAALRLWFNQSLGKGGGVLTLTTRENRPRIERALEHHGYHAQQLQEEGRLVMLDVDEFLEQFNASSLPDPMVFDSLIEENLQRLRDACGHRPIHAWGEAVEALRRRGQGNEASLLEALWTEATQVHDFSLLCSYNVDNLDPNTHQGMMAELTAAHNHRLVDPDPKRLDEAVHHALDELYGKAAARLIWTNHTAQGVLAMQTSHGQRILDQAAAVQTRKEADDLFASTRRHYHAYRPQSVTTPTSTSTSTSTPS